MLACSELADLKIAKHATGQYEYCTQSSVSNLSSVGRSMAHDSSISRWTAEGDKTCLHVFDIIACQNPQDYPCVTTVEIGASRDDGKLDTVYLATHALKAFPFWQGPFKSTKKNVAQVNCVHESG